MNRLAWGLVCLVFLVIGSGGLVTAYGAGMAVADWPTTFGRWFSLPPPGLWGHTGVLFNLLHRTLAPLAALGAVALAAGLWRRDARHAVRRLGLVVPAAVVVSGALGGWRVLADSVPAARLHAATAPLPLALCVAVAAATSPRWLAKAPAREHRRAKALRRWCLGTLGIASLFTLAGVQLRYVPPNAGLTWLPFWTWAAVLLALAGAVAGVKLLLVTRQHFRDCPAIARRSGWLVSLLAAQLLAGGCQWVTTYGWPPWFTDYILPIPYTVVAEGPLQVTATTLHVVLGSLVPAVGLDTFMWSCRLAQHPR